MIEHYPKNHREIMKKRFVIYVSLSSSLNDHKRDRYSKQTLMINETKTQYSLSLSLWYIFVRVYIYVYRVSSICICKENVYIRKNTYLLFMKYHRARDSVVVVTDFPLLCVPCMHDIIIHIAIVLCCSCSSNLLLCVCCIYMLCVHV